jgi:hypothetical protein
VTLTNCSEQREGRLRIQKDIEHVMDTHFLWYKSGHRKKVGERGHSLPAEPQRDTLVD